MREFEPALCEAALPEALSRFGDDVPGPLRPYLSGLPAAAAGPLLARLASGPRTLQHGDARLHNIFAPPQLLRPGCDGYSAAHAEQLRFIDFGDVAAGRGAYDVACLLASGMTPDERCVHARDAIRVWPSRCADAMPRMRRCISAGAEHGLLGEYHDALSEGGVTAYSMYDAWEDYRCDTTHAACTVRAFLSCVRMRV